jgi:hypothetical protein
MDEKQRVVDELDRHFTAFERTVLVAYLDRSMRDLPTYHPAKALKIYQRWRAVIDRGRRVITPDMMVRVK